MKEKMTRNNLQLVLPIILIMAIVCPVVNGYWIGNRVWLDTNEDGLQNSVHNDYCDNEPSAITEPGVEGVVVNLYNCDTEELLATTTTDPDGYYYFGTTGEHCGMQTFGLDYNMMPGTFFVEFELPGGYEFTMLDAGDDWDDSDADSLGRSHCITLSPGPSATNPNYPPRLIYDVSLDAGLIEAPDEQCGECKGKVTQLTLRYDGSSTAEILVTRKVGRRDDPADGEVFWGEEVEPGDEFTVFGNDKDGTLGTEISVYIDGILNTKIHTSCSRPIYPGMISGLFGVVEAYSREGGLICALGPVNIIKAEYKSDKSEFKVEATSIDGGSVTLTVVGYGDMTWKADKSKYEYKVKPVSDPGATITVTSSGGGQDTANVTHK